MAYPGYGSESSFPNIDDPFEEQPLSFAQRALLAAVLVFILVALPVSLAVEAISRIYP